MPCTLHTAWCGRKFRVLGQAPWSGPAFPQKVRQISIFCVYAPFIFHLIITRFEAVFSAPEHGQEPHSGAADPADATRSHAIQIWLQLWPCCPPKTLTPLARLCECSNAKGFRCVYLPSQLGDKWVGRPPRPRRPGAFLAAVIHF